MPTLTNHFSLGLPAQYLAPTTIRISDSGHVTSNPAKFKVAKIIRISNTPSNPGHQQASAPSTNKLIKSFLQSKPLMSDLPEVASLLGQAITPVIAIKTKKVIEYNGVGVICGIKKNKITQATYNSLIKGIITPLTEQHQKNTDPLRTPAAALIDITNLVGRYQFLTKDLFMDRLKDLYLMGGVTIQILRDNLEILKYETAWNIPELYQGIQEIIAGVSKRFHITLHNDNLYGRFFDSSLAAFVVEHSSKNTKYVQSSLVREMVADFKSYPPLQQTRICESVAKYMLKDPQPWAENLQEVQRFIKSEAPNDLIGLFLGNSKYSVPLIVLTTARYISAMPDNFLILLLEASQIYRDIIIPQRVFINTENEPVPARLTGINLAYQKIAFYDGPEELGVGVRPIDRYQTNISGVSAHDQLALVNERAIGIGMSGTSHIMNAVFEQLARKDQKFPIEDARLMVAATLTFSGGHSINEAYTVFGYREHRSFIPTTYHDMLNKGELYRAAINHAYQSLLIFANRLNA